MLFWTNAKRGWWLTSKVRLCSRREPPSEPFIGQARWGCHEPTCYENISLIGAVASGPIPRHSPMNHKVDHCICCMNDGEMSIPVFEQTGDSRNILHEIYYQQLFMEVE